MTDTPADIPQWSIVLLDHLQTPSAALKEVANRLPADPDELYTAEQRGDIQKILQLAQHEPALRQRRPRIAA